MTALALVVAMLGASSGQSSTTSLDGASLAYRSTGSPCPDHAWRLTENGFLGTYMGIAAAGRVSLTVRVAKADSDPGVATLRLRVADFARSWPVIATGPAYESLSQTWDLPAGTYCVRIENFHPTPSKAARPIKVQSLSIAGAGVLNTASDANAIAAADTYIEHFRKGPAQLTLTAGGRPLPHAKMRIRLKSHAFTFGTAVSSGRGRVLDTSWITGSDPEAVNYRNFILRNFNAIVPENAGKWMANEPAPGNLTLRHLDSLMDFAARHGKRVRMHGVLWDVSEPGWVRELKQRALHAATPAERDAAKAELRARISDRIRYLVRERARRYGELDVLNEGVHRAMYPRIFGAEGVAGIYREVKEAVQAAGASTRLVPNEYDVLQSADSADPYANWYRKHVESLRAAGGPVDGIGIQYYAVDDGPARARGPHSPSRIAQVLHNLATADLPLSLSEFGVQRSGEPLPERAAEILADSLRLCFGHDKMTTFICWGFWRPRMWSVAPQGALVDADWNLTPAGKVWQQMTGVHDWRLPALPAWTTDVSLTTDAEGRVDLTGFFGDYEVISDQLRGQFTLSKTTRRYEVALASESPAAGTGPARPQ